LQSGERKKSEKKFVMARAWDISIKAKGIHWACLEEKWYGIDMVK
jgi:hypothetical protein